MNLRWLYWQVGWAIFKLNLMHLESRRRCWIWVGHLSISFRIIPRFSTKLYIKRGETKGIRMFQFGPLLASWPERRSVPA